MKHKMKNMLVAVALVAAVFSSSASAFPDSRDVAKIESAAADYAEAPNLDSFDVPAYALTMHESPLPFVLEYSALPDVRPAVCIVGLDTVYSESLPSLDAAPPYLPGESDRYLLATFTRPHTFARKPGEYRQTRCDYSAYSFDGIPFSVGLRCGDGFCL